MRTQGQLEVRQFEAGFPGRTVLALCPLSQAGGRTDPGCFREDPWVQTQWLLSGISSAHPPHISASSFSWRNHQKRKRTMPPEFIKVRENLRRITTFTSGERAVELAPEPQRPHQPAPAPTVPLHPPVPGSRGPPDSALSVHASPWKPLSPRRWGIVNAGFSF